MGALIEHRRAPPSPSVTVPPAECEAARYAQQPPASTKQGSIRPGAVQDTYPSGLRERVPVIIMNQAQLFSVVKEPRG
jgi:hypothetical protein